MTESEGSPSDIRLRPLPTIFDRRDVPSWVSLWHASFTMRAAPIEDLDS